MTATSLQTFRDLELVNALYTDTLSGLEYGIDITYSWDMLSVLRLALNSHEDFFLSHRFRQVTGIASNRKNYFEVLRVGDEARVIQVLETKSDGILPILYGSMDLFPLDADLILDNSSHILNPEISGMRIVDQGHEEYIIPNIQDYVISDRRYVHYKRALDDDLFLTVNRVHENELMGKFVGSKETQGISYWETSLIQSHLYFGGIIDHTTPDEKLRLYEELFRAYTNLGHIVTRQVYVHSCSRNPKYDITSGGHSLAQMDINRSVDGKHWYWCNIHRLRFGFNLNPTTYNLNDALLVALIIKAKEEGVETLNLGQAMGYDYKSYYKPEKIWKKGLRYV